MSNAWIDAKERRDEWPLRYVAGRDVGDIYGDGRSYRLVVTAGLHQLDGNPSPHWSVTGEILDKSRRGDAAIVACGQITDEIREHFPELAPILALHLSDDEGVPMYAVANARYWMGLSGFTSWNHPGGERPLPDLDMLAGHLRITPAEAADMVERHPEWGDDVVDEITAMGWRWQDESKAARELLTGLIAEQGS